LLFRHSFLVLALVEAFFPFWAPGLLLAGRWPAVPYALRLGLSVCAIVARLTGSLIGLSWFTTGVLTPFRLDGLALGAFLAVTARQPGGLKRLVQALPQVMTVVGGLLAFGVVWSRLGSRQGLGLGGATAPP